MLQNFGIQPSCNQFGTMMFRPVTCRVIAIPTSRNISSSTQANTNPNIPLIDPVKMSATKPASSVMPAKLAQPVELLPTDLARIVSQAHPALLLSAYYLRFPALVADPVSTLLISTLPLTALQIGYVVICLPAVGSSSKSTRKSKPGASKRTTDASTAKGLVGSI